MKQDDVIELARVRAFCNSGAARAVRVGANLSLRDVARSVGVSPTTVLRWERSERSCRGEAALRYWNLMRRVME